MNAIRIDESNVSREERTLSFWFEQAVDFQYDKITLVDAVTYDTTLRYLDDVLREVGLDADDIIPVADIHPKTAIESLIGSYMDDKVSLTVVRMNKHGYESVFIYDQRGERKAVAFVFEETVHAYQARIKKPALEPV